MRLADADLLVFAPALSVGSATSLPRMRVLGLRSP
jgi:hypothetical protein